VYLYDTDIRLGYIKAEQVTVSEADAYENVTYTGYFTVDEGSMKNGRLSVADGKATIAVGDEFVICTERVALSIRVESIEEQIADREAPESTATVTDEAVADGTTEASVDDESEAVVADTQSPVDSSESNPEESEAVTTGTVAETESEIAEESDTQLVETEETESSATD
jgi:hypothetical protein